MSPAPAPESSFVHLDIAQSLQNVGDASALNDLLRMLHDVLERDLPQIAQHMEVHDFPAAQQLLHALKGCIPIFCGPALCGELLAVEQLSKSLSPEAAVAYGPLRQKLETLQTEIAFQVGQFEA